MRRLLTLVVVAAAVFFGAPLVMAHTTGECDALVTRVFADTSAAGDKPLDALVGARVVFEKVMSTVVEMRYPNVPSGVSCTALYWQTLIDPDAVRQLRGQT